MPIYIAMLRGINVGGQKIVRMDRLRELCAELGFKNAETYVQSGNIVLEAGEKAPAAISKGLGSAILREFGFSVPVIVRTAEELRGVIAHNPFLRETGIDASKLHVTFLSEAPLKSAIGNLASLPAKPDQYRVGAREVYLYCPDGYGKTKLSNTALEKALAIEATTRNWKTVVALSEMAARH